MPISTTFDQFIRASVARREELDAFLSPDQPTWAKFDPELGYVLGHSMPRDGLDGCLTISNAGADGARRSVVYADRPCRIHTFGDSFTLCHQVSDHETWQEVLAAHFGEPVRNYGMGGYGAYQAYRRLRKVESLGPGAEYLILYIWGGEDHYRSALRCRSALTHVWRGRMGTQMFHGNFWPNLEMDLGSGTLVERDNPLATPEALYHMTDPEFMVEALRDDLMMQLSAYLKGHIREVDLKLLGQLAEILRLPRAPGAEDERAWVSALRDAYAFATSREVIDMALEFAARHQRKLLIALFCPHITRQLITAGRRDDQPVVDHLRARGPRLRHEPRARRRFQKFQPRRGRVSAPLPPGTLPSRGQSLLRLRHPQDPGGLARTQAADLPRRGRAAH